MSNIVSGTGRVDFQTVTRSGLYVASAVRVGNLYVHPKTSAEGYNVSHCEGLAVISDIATEDQAIAAAMLLQFGAPSWAVPMEAIAADPGYRERQRVLGLAMGRDRTPLDHEKQQEHIAIARSLVPAPAPVGKRS